MPHFKNHNDKFLKKARKMNCFSSDLVGIATASMDSIY